jgi:hypothetical protein
MRLASRHAPPPVVLGPRSNARSSEPTWTPGRPSQGPRLHPAPSPCSCVACAAAVELRAAERTRCLGISPAVHAQHRSSASCHAPWPPPPSVAACHPSFGCLGSAAPSPRAPHWACVYVTSTPHPGWGRSISRLGLAGVCRMWRVQGWSRCPQAAVELEPHPSGCIRLGGPRTEARSGGRGPAAGVGDGFLAGARRAGEWHATRSGTP